MSQLERPPLTHDVKLEDDEIHTIKMSYGLQTDLQRLVPDVSAVIDSVTSNPEVRDYLVRRAMTPATKMISDEKDLVADPRISDPDEVLKLLEWISGHLLYFFAKSARSLASLGTSFKAEMKTAAQQVPSSDGSESSASPTPTAGPSDAASPT